MTNYDYKKISSEYAQALYPDLDTETRSIIEKEGLDFISNLLKKIHSIGSNFLFFEDNGSFNLELRESIGMDMHMDSFLDEGGEEEGYFRFSKETNGSLDFSTDDIVIDTEGIYGGEIEEIRQILVQSDGRERVVTSPGSALSELIPLTDCDLIVDAYQNRHQVDVWNLSDPYFMRDEDEDESNIFLLNIKYPKMGLKYQGLIPHLKKFIREDLQHSNSTLNPIKIIKSINF